MVKILESTEIFIDIDYLFKQCAAIFTSNSLHNYHATVHFFEPYFGKSGTYTHPAKGKITCTIDTDLIIYHLTHVLNQYLTIPPAFAPNSTHTQTDEKRLRDIVNTEHALIKTIGSKAHNDTHWDFLLDQLADPHHIRPIRELYNKANRNRVYNPLTQEWKHRQAHPDRGRSKVTPYIKKTATTFLPTHGQIQLFQNKGTQVAIIFDMRSCKGLDRNAPKYKYIFKRDVWTDARWWISQQHPALFDRFHMKAISLNEMRKYHRQHQTKVPHLNEILARPSRSAVSGIVALQNTLCNRLNALYRREMVVEKLRLHVPVVIHDYTPTAYSKSSLTSYTEKEQILDIFEALTEDNDDAEAKYFAQQTLLKQFKIFIQNKNNLFLQLTLLAGKNKIAVLNLQYLAEANKFTLLKPEILTQGVINLIKNKAFKLALKALQKSPFFPFDYIEKETNYSLLDYALASKDDELIFHVMARNFICRPSTLMLAIGQQQFKEVDKLISFCENPLSRELTEILLKCFLHKQFNLAEKIIEQFSVILSKLSKKEIANLVREIAQAQQFALLEYILKNNSAAIDYADLLKNQVFFDYLAQQKCTTLAALFLQQGKQTLGETFTTIFFQQLHLACAKISDKHIVASALHQELERYHTRSDKGLFRRLFKKETETITDLQQLSANCSTTNDTISQFEVDVILARRDQRQSKARVSHYHGYSGTLFSQAKKLVAVKLSHTEEVIVNLGKALN